MKNFYFLVYPVLALAMLSGPVNLVAQDAPANGTTAQMVVSVEARHGNNPPDIDRADVMVYEGRDRDKDRDKVVDWVPAQGDHAGLELFILLDDSSSTSLDSQLNDIRQFITAQPPSTLVGVAYMQNGIARVEQNLTTDHTRAAKALRLPLGIRGVNGSPYFSLTDL